MDPDPPRSAGLYCLSALLPQGWCRNVRLEIRQGRFSRIEIEALPQPGDQTVAIAIPGVANLHSHAFQRGMAGLAEQRGPTDDSFWTWRELMYRFTARIAPDDLQALAAMAYAEMLEAGFTRVAEFHYLHHDSAGRPFDDPAEMAARIIAAAAQTGIGLTLLPVFYAHGGFGGAAAGTAQARFLSTPDSYAALFAACARALTPLPDAVLGIAPHSLRAVTPVELAAILPLAARQPIHLHIAEQRREVDDCLAWCGARPVAWLLDHCAVDGRWCLVHATHLAAAERKALAASGAVVGLCPVTEANLGDGLFPLREFLKDGGCYGVGSDSNVLISLAEELRLLEYGQRLQRRGRNIAALLPGAATGRALFDAALQGGAQASGSGGGLAAGAPADLLSLAADHPALTARQDDAWLDSLIFAAPGSLVQAVWRAGRQVVQDGRHRQRPAIEAAYRASLKKLLS